MDALGVAGDVSSAGAALAGLLLVFMGSTSTAFEGYQPQERRAVKRRFQLRVWFAFFGFALAVASASFALLAKAYTWTDGALIALLCLFTAFVMVIAAGIRSALDIK